VIRGKQLQPWHGTSSVLRKVKSDKYNNLPSVKDTLVLVGIISRPSRSAWHNIHQWYESVKRSRTLSVRIACQDNKVNATLEELIPFPSGQRLSEGCPATSTNGVQFWYTTGQMNGDS
jgi:hypothetical protein